MSLDNVALIVMAKYPEAGRVKTRLSPALSAEQAAMVHRTFLGHVMSRLSRLGAPELVMCFDPPDSGRSMFQMIGSRATRYIAQSPGNLGERLDSAARDVGKWYGRLLFLGVDSPDIPIAHIARAAELLASHEVVVGPCGDGGFWCLGMQHHVNPQLLLDGIEWSSGREREQTLAKARELDCSFAEADSWDDIDRPDDLQKLLSRLATSQNEDDRRLLEGLSFVRQGVAS